MEQTASFSKRLKIELSGIPYACGDCKAAEVYGLLLFGRSFSGNKKTVSFTTEHKAVADRFVSDVIDLTSAIVTLKYIGSRYRKGGKLYIADVEDEVDSELIDNRFSARENENFLESELIKNSCCRSAFLRGAFMACGSVIDPQKEYHLEFVVQSSGIAKSLRAFLAELGIPIKSTTRKNMTVLYLKESENIEDILTLMGAVRSSLEIMNVKIVKDVRNKVNRVTNCETANIGKTVAAAAEQIADIKYIESEKGIGYLADDLCELARLRLENPDMSLKELSGMLGEPISRSGVNHRLKRISAAAEELRKSGETKQNEDRVCVKGGEQK